MNVVVVDMGKVGMKKTCKTTAFITALQDVSYHDLISRIGIEKTKLYLDSLQEAILEYKKLDSVYDFDFEEVSSVYEENGKLYKRSFIFEPKNELKNEQNVETTDKKLTTIKLTSIKTKYKFDFPTDLKILADLIIEHFFIDFITGKIPNIYIHDECNGTLWINKYYKEEAEYEVEKTSFEILDKNFDIYHIKASNINKSNKLYLCADNRKVSHIDLRKHIPNLQSNISNDDGKKKWYFAYLTSEYLNEMVNSERTEFNFPDEDKTEMGFIDISLDTLTKKNIDIISSFLEKDLQIIEKEKRDRIDKYIFTKAPKYRQLKKYCPNFYFNIPNDAKDDKLEMALYSTQRDWEKEIKKKGLQLRNKAKKYNADEIEVLKEEYLQGVSAIGKASLTDYICKRKAILNILDNSLSAKEDVDALNYNDALVDYTTLWLERVFRYRGKFVFSDYLPF